MSGRGSKFCVSSFAVLNYQGWSKAMKEYLVSEGLWRCVEKGLQKPNQTQDMSASKMRDLRRDIVNDTRALSLIHESLPPSISMKIFSATTAKEAWDAIHSMSLDISRTEELEDESSGGFCIHEGVLPLSGDKPFFDMVLMKSATKPLCHLNFPSRVNSILPSTNILAKVNFFGKTYDIYFFGQRKQKSLGSGWRVLLAEQNLQEGDFLVFEILKSTDSKLELSMQILRPSDPNPLELEDEMSKRGINSDPEDQMSKRNISSDHGYICDEMSKKCINSDTEHISNKMSKFNPEAIPLISLDDDVDDDKE